MMRAFAINTIGPSLIAGALAQSLPRGRKSVLARGRPVCVTMGGEWTSGGWRHSASAPA